MNEPTYTCPACGNTDVFIELVWEQRRYPIDGAGETTAVSEPVEETEVPVEVSCARCGAVVKQLEISCFRAGAYITNYQPKQEFRDFLRRDEDLPPYTDYDDTIGQYLEEFNYLVTTENQCYFTSILHEYRVAPTKKRILINWLFIQLCGHSLPNIIKKAHGHEPDDESDHHKPSEAR
jgi:hypothetical protein